MVLFTWCLRCNEPCGLDAHTVINLMDGPIIWFCSTTWCPYRCLAGVEENDVSNTERSLLSSRRQQHHWRIQCDKGSVTLFFSFLLFLHKSEVIFSNVILKWRFWTVNDVFVCKILPSKRVDKNKTANSSGWHDIGY